MIARLGRCRFCEGPRALGVSVLPREVFAIGIGLAHSCPGGRRAPRAFGVHPAVNAAGPPRVAVCLEAQQLGLEQPWHRT